MKKREKVFKKTNGKCIYCGCDIDFYNFHMDHKKPRKKLQYDFDNINNLFPSCIDCNLLKGDLEVEEFREKLESFIFKDTRCRALKKFYNLEPKKIKFFFEKQGENKNV